MGMIYEPTFQPGDVLPASVVNNIIESIKEIDDRDRYIKTELPEAENGIITLESNIEYFIGEESKLNIKFPTNAQEGDYIFLKFLSGIVATQLTIVQEKVVGNTEIIPKSTSVVEIYGSYNGSEWLIQYLMY